jgi:hypothetical protein
VKYWYNISTGAVEDDEHTSRKDDLMGPYETAEAAQHALELARARTTAWDERERRDAEAEWRD